MPMRNRWAILIVFHSMKDKSFQPKQQTVSQSEFMMWRAVFAFAFVDNVLSLEEQELLQSYLATVPFSPGQRQVLKEDLRHPKNVVELYNEITDDEDKKRFCVFARAIVWCEGDITQQEAAILKKVSCMKDAGNDDILRSTRFHPHIGHYYEQYAKSGVVGLFKQPHLVEIRV